MFYDGSIVKQDFLPHNKVSYRILSPQHSTPQSLTTPSTTHLHTTKFHDMFFTTTPNTAIIASHTTSSHNKYIYRFLSPQSLTLQSLISAPTTSGVRRKFSWGVLWLRISWWSFLFGVHCL